MTDRATQAATPAFVLGHMAVCALAWGSSFLFIKMIGPAMPPVHLATARGAFAALAVGLTLAAMRQWPLPRVEEIAPWAIIGLLNGAIPNTLVAYAMQRMDSGPAVLIQSVGPLFTAIAAHCLFADERLNAQSATGVLVGLLGVGLLIGPEAGAGAATLPAVLAMLGVALCYTLGNLYTRTVRHHHPLRLAMGQQLFSAIIAGVVALALGGAAAFAGAGDHLPSLIALGVVCTALPIAAFMRLIVRAGPTRAALTGYAVPAVAVVMGAIVLDERLSVWQAAGGLTVLLGVFLVASAGRGRA